MAGSPADEIRSLNYLLSEIARWEQSGILGPEQASSLRESYEQRRESLRQQLVARSAQVKQSASPQPTVKPPEPSGEVSPPEETEAAATKVSGAPQPALQETPPFYPPAVAPLPARYAPRLRERMTRRTLLEKLSDPHTMRILLYSGAGMLVVGIVVLLRDILYLKLQEPIVQAGLLAIGTIIVTVSGWYTILRTRLLITGRALTVTGSLLVPVNFWFLVRSGLIEDNGRAWLVCAFCTLLYAHTAALLREKLYVYLASLAAIATSWTLIYAHEREAIGLYALTLSLASLIFLHLSRLFPKTTGEHDQATNKGSDNPQSAIRNPQLLMRSMSYELWGPPLVHVALIGAVLAVIFYMPWRIGASPSFRNGIFRFGAVEYDASIAMLLVACLAYAAWFAGRYVYQGKRQTLYLTSALALLWTEFLALDGLELPAQTQLLIIAATTTLMALAARLISAGDALSVALHRASLLASAVLLSVAYAVISAAEPYTITHAFVVASLAATLAVASAPRFGDRALSKTLAHLSAIFSTLAFLFLLASLRIDSITLFFSACAVWPFFLYAVSALALGFQTETQLAAPFRLIADIEYAMLLALACALAFALDQAVQSGLWTMTRQLGVIFSLLTGAVLYGSLRAVRDRSVFGAALLAVGLLTLVAAAGDTLKYREWLDATWPVATAVIMAAFLMREAADRLWREEQGQGINGNSRLLKLAEGFSRAAIVRLVADCAVVASASLWLVSALYHLNEGGTSAAAVMLLATLYWGEHAARLRRPWLAYVFAAHVGALLITLLVAMRIEAQWFATALALVLFPLFFLTERRARGGRADWLARPASVSAAIVIALVSALSIFQALAHLRINDPLLLAPAVAFCAVAAFTFAASLWSASLERVRYFRVGLYASALAFVLFCLRSGLDPVGDVEIYTMPVAVLLLLVSYFSSRKDWREYSADTSLNLWMGSLLLTAPLLIHALYFRLALGVPAAGRDLLTLSASLLLLLFGVMGRLRAPVLIGGATLILELAALTVTSVDWLQVPLKVYLISVGALILIVWGLLEFRREQILALRQRLSERRETARERFGEWR